MRKIIVSAMIASFLLLAACGGRDPDPIMVSRAGDGQKSCEVLIYDIGNLEYKIHQLLPETEGKTVQNVAYGVAGFYTFFIPWLLIDFNNAEAKEYEALRQRHAHLSTIAIDKGCDVSPSQYPSIEDVKKDYEFYKSNNQIQ